MANLPYNIGVPALLHLLAEFPSIRTVTVMVQAEVAERLAARLSSTKEYGVPSVKVRFYGDVRRCGSVSPTVFWPIPGCSPDWFASIATRLRRGRPTRSSGSRSSNWSTPPSGSVADGAQRLRGVGRLG